MTLRPSFGIFPKLLLTMLVVTLIPLGAIWYLDYRAESESLSREIEQRLGSQADAIVGYVDAWVEMHLRMLRQNAALEDMSSMDGKRQKPLLRAIATEYKWIYLGFTIAPDGNNVGRNDEEPLRFYGDRGYFKQAIDGRQMGQEVVISSTTGQAALILLGVTVVFVILVSYALAVGFTRPIRRLTQIADGISRGNLGANIAEAQRSDEIGSLARAIERLRASVKLAVDRLGTR